MVKPPPGGSSIRSSAPNEPAITLPCPVQCTMKPPSPPINSDPLPHLESRLMLGSLASHDPLVNTRPRCGATSITAMSPGSLGAMSTQVGACGEPLKVVTKKDSPPRADRFSAFMNPPCIWDCTVTPNDCITITPASPWNCSPGARCNLAVA